MTKTVEDLVVYKMYIDGQWVDSTTEETVESIDPTTGRAWAKIPSGGPEDVNRAVASAHEAASGEWGRWKGTDRSAALRRLADLVDAHRDRLALLETRDNGKLLRETSSQFESIPEALHYFAGWADKLTGETIPTEKLNQFVFTLLEPIGVVAAIVPWNSPAQLAVAKIGPALAAGCPVVVKPSEYTSATALELAALADEAGFPPGVLNVVTGLGTTVGSQLVTHPGIAKVSFTGSSSTGRRIVEGSARNITGLTLELGGKSANIVFSDADIDLAVNGVLSGIFAASGQTCIAGSRLVVHEDVHDRLVEAVTQRAREIEIGDPRTPTTELGPLAFEGQLHKVTDYVEIALDEGAELSAGGHRVTQPGLTDGYFFEPTVLTEVRNDMRVAREEIFGPVLAVISFKDADEAVAIANDSEFGLAAGVWTSDYRLALGMSSALDAQTVWVNDYRVASHAVPFGGFKGSGMGYQGGREGVYEFVRTKSVWMETAGEARDPFRLG